MAIKESIRTGGRSARVQQSIHAAVQQLLGERGRSELTVPMVAHLAGVTPSTIYRRWGDLAALLGDVAVERLQPDGEPADCGTLRSDLYAWSEQYLDEMSSPLGRGMLQDVLASQPHGCAGKCATLVRKQLEIILARALKRGEAGPEADRLVDAVVAPMIYRILFADSPPDAAYVRRLIDGCLLVG